MANSWRVSYDGRSRDEKVTPSDVEMMEREYKYCHVIQYWKETICYWMETLKPFRPGGCWVMASYWNTFVT